MLFYPWEWCENQERSLLETLCQVRAVSRSHPTPGLPGEGKRRKEKGGVQGQGRERLQPEGGDGAEEQQE